MFAELPVVKLPKSGRPRIFAGTTRPEGHKSGNRPSFSQPKLDRPTERGLKTNTSG